MHFFDSFDGLSLPRNQSIELSPLATAPLAEIWAKFPGLTPWTMDSAGPLPPFYPQTARLEQVQVIGLNPSYTESDRKELVYCATFDSHPYFRRIDRFGQQVAARYEQLFLKQTTTPSEQLYHFGKLDYGHLDLLYMRTTNQRALEIQVWQTPGAASFVWQQLQLTKRLLAALQPVAIVIANRFGQRLTGFQRNSKTGADEWMGLQFTPQPDDQGTYRITGSTTNGQPDPDGAYGLVGTPVFFTGSFAGTNPRSTSADTALVEQIAQTCLRDGTRYFSQWYMQ